MMPDLKVIIGGRNFNISCNPGEESAARESANLLNKEAELLNGQLGRLPEDKMLLLSGLLLGDKIRALKHEQIALEATLRTTQAKLNELVSKSDPSRSGLDRPVPPSTVNNSASSSEEKALKELQDISDILDNIIIKSNVPYPKQELNDNSKISEDEAQESFL
jgi:cell division protein ZapA